MVIFYSYVKLPEGRANTRVSCGRHLRRGRDYETRDGNIKKLWWFKPDMSPMVSGSFEKSQS